MSRLWINGVIVDKLNAHVSPLDHGLLYGDGVWEALRVVNDRMLLAHEHLEQLFLSASTIALDIPLSPEQIQQAIETTLAANHRRDAYVRIIVTRGPGTIGPDPRKLAAQIIIIAEQYHPFPLELIESGIHAATFHHPVNITSCLWPARLLGQPYLVLAKQAALHQGCLEAILINDRGEATGSTEGLLFRVKSGDIQLAAGQQPDAIAACVKNLAEQCGFRVTQTSLPLQQIREADELFIAGTAPGVVSVIRLDGSDIGSGQEGPVSRAVREAYQRLVEGAASSAC